MGVAVMMVVIMAMIVVVVVMDFMSQLQAHMMSHHYPGLLKKANLLGYGRSGSGG